MTRLRELFSATRPHARDVALAALTTWCAVMVTLALTRFPL